jgi:hypothetical protein
MIKVFQEGFGIGPGSTLMPVDHPTWAALGVTRGNNVRLLQTPSEEGAQSVAGDMSNPVSKKFFEVGLGMNLYESIFSSMK